MGKIFKKFRTAVRKEFVNGIEKNMDELRSQKPEIIKQHKIELLRLARFIAEYFGFELKYKKIEPIRKIGKLKRMIIPMPQPSNKKWISDFQRKVERYNKSKVA